MTSPSDPSPRTGGDPPEAEPPSRLSLDVVPESGNWPDVETAMAIVEKAAEAVARAPSLAFGCAAAAVALSDDDQVRRLNALYRGIDKPTNVLSFPAPQSPFIDSGGIHFLGDVVIAAETVVREAEALGVPFEHHLSHLAVHGLLHLLGYDHQTEAEAERMEALETEILARIGVPNPYDARAFEIVRS